MKMSEVKKNRSLRVNPGTNDKNSQCLIRMNSSFRIRWDLIVMLCAIWNWLTIPLELTFEPPFAEDTLYIIFNSFIDVLFTLDIILTFRTTFISSKTGYEVSDPKKIAKNYILGRFWVDFFTVFPFSYISFLRPFRAIGILKVNTIIHKDQSFLM